jgi:apolipoprotein N-acyltransferase
MVAYSQVRLPLLIQTADLAGPYGLGFVIAAANACFAARVAPRLLARGARVHSSTYATAALVAAVLAYGAWCTAKPYGDGTPVRVRLVQAGAPERGPELREQRLARHVALSSLEPAAYGVAPDLIIWPENALDGYLQETSAARRAVLGLTRASGVELIVGGPSYERARDGTRYHNSAFLVRGDDVVARYDKHRLVPFAEDGRGVPGDGSVAARYTAGEGSSVLDLRGLRAGMLLCFEAMFPELARAATDAGADVLLNLSNDGWFGRPEAARQQLDIATLRAVESRRFLVRAAATGISAVIDPHGRTLAQTTFGTHDVLDASVRASHARTLYQRWGDAPAWLMIAIAAVASLRLAIRRRATHDERNTR